MKKLLLSILAGTAFFSLANAQTVVFSENFDATTGVALPVGWTEYNVDGHTVNSGLSTFNFGTHAWVTSNNLTLAQANGTRFVVSTSWYTPAATSDDWLVTPAITLTANDALKWMAKAQDPNYPDGYQVKISTTGNAVADFTTNLLTVPAEAPTWSVRSVDLSAYSGQTVYLAFRNNSNDKFLLCFDDVQVLELPAIDGAISGVTPAAGTSPSYTLVGANNTISATVTNNGYTAITSLDFKYSDGVNTFTDTKSGLNIPTFGTLAISHSTTFSTPGLGSHPLTVWIEVTGDANAANDNSSTDIQGVSFFPPHNVVFEEATGTWCGWCPRGAVFMDSMANVNGPSTVLIAVHNSDPMTVTDYDAGVGTSITGYPSVLVNRNIVDDPSNMFPQYAAHIGDFGYATLTETTVYNAITHTFNITANGDFAAELNGDYRLAVVITEDNVSGTGATWDQHNYYSFQTNNLPLQGAGHNWQNETDPIPAASMQYDHVARVILGGYTGQSGSLPASISAGTSHSYNFNYIVPAGVNVNNTHINVLLIDAANSRILNGITGTFTTGVAENDAILGSFGVNPNPVSDVAYVNYTLKNQNQVSIAVTNVLGETVFTSDLGNQGSGDHKVEINSSSYKNGLYFVSLTVGSKRYTEKISVNN